MDAIRPLAVGDAEQLAALLVRNRPFLAPFEPERAPEFFTVGGQAERLTEAEARRRAGTGFLYGIVDDRSLAGTITLSNVARGVFPRGVFQSASVGYWVDRERNGRGLASDAPGRGRRGGVRAARPAPTRGGHPHRQHRVAARAREERVRADRGGGALPEDRGLLAGPLPLPTHKRLTWRIPTSSAAVTMRPWIVLLYLMSRLAVVAALEAGRPIS